MYVSQYWHCYWAAPERKGKKQDSSTETIENTKAAEKTKTVDKTERPRPSSSIVINFLNDVRSLEDDDSINPITSFQEAADHLAAKVMSVNKDNIEAFLEEAKKYKQCVITTADHTIVKIDDPGNCKPSGSWGACMPYAKGYIKKGELDFQEDYMNYIIGLPDEQERTAYLFN